MEEFLMSDCTVFYVQFKTSCLMTELQLETKVLNIKGSMNKISFVS